MEKAERELGGLPRAPPQKLRTGNDICTMCAILLTKSGSAGHCRSQCTLKEGQEAGSPEDRGRPKLTPKILAKDYQTQAVGQHMASRHILLGMKGFYVFGFISNAYKLGYST